MSENRMLATLAKQAALAQEQISQLQELVQETLAPPPPLPFASTSTSHQHLHPGHGDEPESPGAPAASRAAGSSGGEGADDKAVSVAALARKVRVLAAALRHSDGETKRSLTQLRGLLGTVQEGVQSIAQRSIETAKSQTQAVLEVSHKR